MYSIYCARTWDQHQLWGAAPESGGVTHFCKYKHSYGTLLSTADTGITRTDVMKCMYTFICNCMYISTSYYRILVQELRVFRPQNAPNSVPCNLSATAHNWWNQGPQHPRTVRELWSESPPSTRRHTSPTRAIPDAPQGAAVLRRAEPEFRVILHGMTRVTQF